MTVRANRNEVFLWINDVLSVSLRQFVKVVNIDNAFTCCPVAIRHRFVADKTLVPVDIQTSLPRSGAALHVLGKQHGLFTFFEYCAYQGFEGISRWKRRIHRVPTTTKFNQEFALQDRLKSINLDGSVLRNFPSLIELGKHWKSQKRKAIFSN